MEVPPNKRADGKLQDIYKATKFLEALKMTKAEALKIINHSWQDGLETSPFGILRSL